MISDERLQTLPAWVKRISLFLKKTKVPARITFIIISLLATAWFLIRVIPKPARATYPCMQVAAPIMSGICLQSLKGKLKLIYREFRKVPIRWKFIRLGIGQMMRTQPISIWENQTIDKTSG